MIAGATSHGDGSRQSTVNAGALTLALFAGTIALVGPSAGWAGPSSAPGARPHADVAELILDPAAWRRLETLPPTPRGGGYLPPLASGAFAQVRFAVPKDLPPVYLVNLHNVVAMEGRGTAYQVEVRLDGPTGAILYAGPHVRIAVAVNYDEALTHLDATRLLTPAHCRQGYVDLWVTVHVTNDKWTLYRDQDNSQWDMYALVPEAAAWARWQTIQRQRDEMLARGIAIIPQPQEIEPRPGDFHVDARTTVRLIGSDTADDRATAEFVRQGFSDATNLPIAISATEAPRQVRLIVTRVPAVLRDAVGDVAQDFGDQGYVLHVTPDGIAAVAHTGEGLWYAAQSLLQIVNRRQRTVPCVRIVDWPDLKNRMVQYDLARSNTVDVAYWKRWVRELSRLKINQLMIYMEDDYRFEKYPFLGRSDAFTPAKARELVAYARRYRVDLVPQLESLGHAGRLLAHKELADIRSANASDVICPCAPRALPLLDDLFGELCAAFDQSPLFHVGADEVWPG